jgi:hypothetical protein
LIRADNGHYQPNLERDRIQGEPETA